MSTPSLRPLSFNVSPLPLYCQLLSIILFLDKMASVPPEELLLFPLILWMRVRELQKHQEGSCRLVLPQTHPHTRRLSELHGGSVKGLLERPVPCAARLSPPQVNAPDRYSLTWVALSIPINSCVWMAAAAASRRPPVLQLRSPSPSLCRGFTRSL